MKTRTLIAIPLMMGLLLLQPGCGIFGPPLVLQPSELCSDHGNSAIATFMDPNLERAVRTWPGVGAEEDLTCGLVSGIPGWNFSGYGIKSLVGIQNLTGMTGLLLWNNSISDISPLSGLTGLAGLSLTNNSITDISALSGLTALRTLSLGNSALLANTHRLVDNTGNAISDISPLSGLTSLTFLGLQGNSITDISALRGLTNLGGNTFLGPDLELGNNTSLSNIQPLLDNTGLGAGDTVDLQGTSVSCTDVALLEARGVFVDSDCA